MEGHPRDPPKLPGAAAQTLVTKDLVHALTSRKSTRFGNNSDLAKVKKTLQIRLKIPETYKPWTFVVVHGERCWRRCIMIRRGETSRMTSLFFLAPPCTTALSYLVPDKPVGETAVAGMAAAAVGVALVMVPPGRHPTGWTA